MKFSPNYQLYGMKHKVRLAGVNFCDDNLVIKQEEAQKLDKQSGAVLMLFSSDTDYSQVLRLTVAGVESPENPIPELATILLIGLGSMMMLWQWRRS
ncbi:hypothetical protein SAMN05216339_102347 [Nitrosomonas eutropha]|uniref:PEP-CTERM protein-sorting domain-containing protein n=1 Tax=Nitrosomonas eutropha TaxID=916 RepID=A0A1I7GB97_9PROT|nr:hypothetical protein [Nitrosomonas eutropha]SFU45719.1 hypothetical protein SAMN05216339_102347 [Nitrosomonas eutropha]